ncbi:MAG: selenocysteine-specific translation elongation factor [Oscillospiraceae bacterium]|nr:selenocysteine-specific translation elongation factor [Oscillospiraceae bacterium]
MKHVIIGTAGHVDHGKTALVKALTGIDTDRLEEEKRRGVTIEPGFAYLDFEDGSRAGIIDVPGHERFIRNMLAGSGGVDLAMLVIAADEGVMPQTREHLGILSQLGISDGLVVITKADKVDAEWLELVTEDILELVSGTFLESKEIVAVSSHSGIGIQELKIMLQNLIACTGEKNTDVPFRLPIDRVFPVDGFGTVVTGTLIEGSVCVGDTVEILPSGKKAPVRSIQVHGDNAEKAYAGQRTAISLAGVKRGEILRGDTLATEGMFNTTDIIDVKLSILPDSERIIKTGTELHLYHGARTLLSKVFLIDKNELHKSESCYARFKLKEQLPCKRGDRFVVRFFSPLETIGGGVILDSSPTGRISRTKEAINALEIRESGDSKKITHLTAAQLGGVFSRPDLCKRADLDKKVCNEVIDELTKTGDIIKLMQDKYIASDVIERISKECTELLKSYHKDNPLKTGISRAELRQRLFSDYDTAEANSVFEVLKSRSIILLSDKVVSLPDFTIEYSNSQQAIYNKLIKELISSGYDVKTPQELADIFTKNEKREFEQIFENMISSGELVMLSKQVYWLRDVYDKAVCQVKSHIDSENEITLAQCRDILKTTRKYALTFLEHLDGKNVTGLQGESRKLIKGFDAL